MIILKIAIPAKVQMAADKEAVGQSRVHMHESSIQCPYEIIVYSVFKH